jgi:multiple sugar transport system permease protein
MTLMEKNPKTQKPVKHLGNAQMEERILGYLFVLPVVMVILLLVYYPLVQGFSMSLRSLDFALGLPDRFIGFKNYIRVVRDPDVIATTLHTFGYLVVAIVAELIGGLTFALTLNSQFRGRGFILALMILPWALPGIVSGELWSRIFHPDNGLLNNVLYRLGIIQNYQIWFFKPFWSIIFIGLVHVWNNLPLTTLMLLAGLQTIPAELYDSSAVDGASPFYQLRAITLPLLRPAFAVALTIGTVNALGIFDQIYVLNGFALGTRSVIQQIYLMTFAQLNFGKGTALAFWLTFVTLFFSIGYIRSLRSLR